MSTGLAVNTTIVAALSGVVLSSRCIGENDLVSIQASFVSIDSFASVVKVARRALVVVATVNTSPDIIKRSSSQVAAADMRCDKSDTIKTNLENFCSV